MIRTDGQITDHCTKPVLAPRRTRPTATSTIPSPIEVRAVEGVAAGGLLPADVVSDGSGCSCAGLGVPPNWLLISAPIRLRSDDIESKPERVASWPSTRSGITSQRTM